MKDASRGMFAQGLAVPDEVKAIAAPRPEQVKWRKLKYKELPTDPRIIAAHEQNSQTNAGYTVEAMLGCGGSGWSAGRDVSAHSRTRVGVVEESRDRFQAPTHTCTRSGRLGRKSFRGRERIWDYTVVFVSPGG